MEEVKLDWTGGLAFEAHRAEFVTPIDGDSKIAPSPVTYLLHAVAACSAIDVVDILAKGRQNVERLQVVARGERREKPPRRFLRLEFEFDVEGDVLPAKALRAVDLSFETYCSVFHTLRTDLDVSWELRVNGSTVDRPDRDPNP